MKKIILSAFLLFALTLTSCNYIHILSSSSEPASSISSSSQPTTTSIEPTPSVPTTYENLVKHSVFYESAIPTSVKKSKYLVLPVWFKDSASLIKTGESKESILANITTAFSGTTEETGWNSVKTFYETESGGKKEFVFTIADWYDCDVQSRNVAGDQNNNYVAENTENIIYKAINNFFKEYPTENRKDYDSDGDGYLDAVAVIYAIQDYKSDDFNFDSYYGGGSHSNLWAYVYWFQEKSYQNVNYPGPNAYLWASYNFSNVSKKQAPGYPITVDAHAYIHETGHLFGLDDYYDYIGSNKPGGGFSMQDYNVGMHDPYSLISLGWGDITAPTETSTITLKPFTSDRQVILLSNNYQDSIFDEYLLLELYTPDGLNELDSTYAYDGNYPQGPKTPGIRLWHVDARLAYKLGRGYDFDYSDKQITNVIDEHLFYNVLCRNNTFVSGEDADYFSPLAVVWKCRNCGHIYFGGDAPSVCPECGEEDIIDRRTGRVITPAFNRCYDYNYEKYRLLELVRNNDILKVRGREDFEEEDLFTEGSSFDMTTYRKWFVEDGKLNNGENLGWSFTVDAISSESATITVTKL